MVFWSELRNKYKKWLYNIFAELYVPRRLVVGKHRLFPGNWSWQKQTNKQTNKQKRFKLVPRNPNRNFCSTVTERINLKLEANTFNVGIYLNWVGCGSGRHRPQYTTMEAERRVLGGWREEDLDSSQWIQKTASLTEYTEQDVKEISQTKDKDLLQRL